MCHLYLPLPPPIKNPLGEGETASRSYTPFVVPSTNPTTEQIASEPTAATTIPFNRIKIEDEHNAQLMPKAWRLPFFRLVERPAFEYLIICCILLSTLFLMTEHHGEPE